MLSLRTTICFVLALIGAASAQAKRSSPTSRIDLPDSFAGQQILVSAANRDVTREATYTSDKAAVARVDSSGYVTAVSNGAATIHVQHTAGNLDISVKVSGVGAGGRAVDFRTEVMPLLSKLGC